MRCVFICVYIILDIQGILIRKHEWESKNRKASNRSWHEFLVVLSVEKNRLLVYKDEKHFNERPQDTYHKDSGLDVSDLSAAPATDYLKRPFVFRVKVTSSGAEYLFQVCGIGYKFNIKKSNV